MVDEVGRGGVPVLFVHGNGGHRGQWSAQLDHLESRRRALALDLRGFGESHPPADGDFSLEAFASDVDAAVTTLGLRRFVLVGHSFGGAVVATYAARQGHRVAGLVLVDAVGDTRRAPTEEVESLFRGLAPETYVEFTRSWFERLLQGATTETRRHVLDSLKATPRQVFVESMKSLLDFNPKSAIPLRRAEAHPVRARYL